MKNVDHVYYDNLYNICKIYLDDRGCPSAFEFYDKDARNEALELISNLCLDSNGIDRMQIFYLFDIFKYLQLIMDDYNLFDMHCVYLTKYVLLKINDGLDNILAFDIFDAEEYYENV